MLFHLFYTWRLVNRQRLALFNYLKNLPKILADDRVGLVKLLEFGDTF
jgi:hypothetical protein